MNQKELTKRTIGNAPIKVDSLVEVETLPEAALMHRGKTFILSTPGLEDRLCTCLLKSDGSYAWFEVTAMEII